ncbi:MULTISPECIES: sensor histidine kinase [Sphaerochaeta]|jgi:two-component system sensor histidine kinase YesM|uniref:Sensor histidine kinase n=1 Tax=Sphaerochaeta associata TaxID=1129264 RepID=A0ABY4D935_9SPIR|nr:MULTISPECIES: sensor histidine kinase [Sphaerochaeta]MDX9983528.1 sensor histidine kinase [Sphaerochaeta sp.]UOM50455.1 sensor histidine kinase [Sphaerochaeta associata]SMP41675.1 two-component system, sensor histidine kinase YesM [Sphaerochaeta associata]
MKHQISMVDKIFSVFKSRSIKERIKLSYVIIILLMITPPVITIFSFVVQMVRYDLIITNVSKTNRLNQTVKMDISNEVWDIVAGNKKFEEGRQYDIIDGINESLDDIMRTTEERENRQMLEVAGRAVDTLRRNVDRLGSQMANQSLVSANEEMLDEIRGVSALISDILQDFIVRVIESATITNEHHKRITFVLTVIQIFTVVFVAIFAVFTQRSVTASINDPIKRLDDLSKRIAEGDFTVRVKLPQVSELDGLTDNLNIMAVKIQELIAENVREQQNLQKSEMKALQAQITPHFLYNTFDTIVWLAEEKKNDQVIDITRAFSSFFRISLNKGKDYLTVSEEFEHVKSYLTIQKIRYRDILDYEIEYEPEMASCQILKLVLQPLVENALYHGIKNKRGRGFLSVKGWRENNRLCFSVQDNGIGMTEEKLANINQQINGSADPEDLNNVYGLYNVNKRLELYYDASTKLEITSRYQEGTTVYFSVPEVGFNV